MKINVLEFAVRYPRYCKYWTKMVNKSIATDLF